MTYPFENVLPANADTLITISSFGNMMFQARGASQTLTVIGAASQQDRTINGTLIDLSAPQFRKYASQINIPSEVYAPPLDGIFPGMIVTIGCAVTLAFVTGTAGCPHRTEVSGSQWTENGYTFYRPLLTMMVKSVETQLDEWKAIIGWKCDLEEV